MKTIMKLLVICILCFNINFSIQSQTLEVENTYKISGKSKRGALGNVTFDSEKGIYSLVYVTKENKKKAKFQTYRFDRDFNFIDKTDDIIEFEKAKAKYTWFEWNGELYTTEGMYVQPNLMGTLVLKKKRITYKYDWLLLGYYKSVDILKKVKPKTDDGRKYFYYTHAEDDTNGEVHILCGIKDKMKKGADPYMHSKKYVILRYNKDVELVGETMFEMKYPQTLAFTRRIANEENGTGSMAFIFAPTGGPGMKKYADPDKNNYHYVRINNKPKIVDNITFKSPAAFWKINQMIHETNTDAIYLFGPSAMDKDKYYNTLTGTSKFKAVQLMKVASNKIEYLTETDLAEFESKLKKPPSQKKSPSYEGKKFQIANYQIASNGDFFVTGQDFKTSKEGNKYLDVMGFHFDTKGILKTQYSIDTKESNKIAKANGTQQFFIENADKTHMYWFLLEIKGASMAKGKMLTYPRIGKVDLKEGSINDFTSYGADGKHFLDPLFPFLETDKGSNIVFFGSDKSGKEIWFSRIRLD